MLVSTVELFLRARRGRKLGIEGTDSLRFNWRAVIARKDEIVAEWSKGKNNTPTQLGVPALMGRGEFVGDHENDQPRLSPVLRPDIECERFPDQCPCTTELGKGIA